MGCVAAPANLGQTGRNQQPDQRRPAPRSCWQAMQRMGSNLGCNDESTTHHLPFGRRLSNYFVSMRMRERWPSVAIDINNPRRSYAHG